MSVMYYWQLSQISIRANRHSDDPCEEKQIFMDDTFNAEVDICWLHVFSCTHDTNIMRTSSSKVLVVTSREHYLQEKQSTVNEDLYHDVYWCKHSYHHQTKRIQLLPSDFIQTNRTTATTPMKQSTHRTRKRDRQTMINEALEDAYKALMLSTVPNHLPCRKKEYDRIEAYMKKQIMSLGRGNGLYISGMPGSGKTALVRQIANELKSHVDLPEFEFVEINAMTLPTPQHIYTELIKKLLPNTLQISPDTAVHKLVKYFSTKDDSGNVIVSLVDELDCLLTQQQKVIYNLFDWPT
eukprot:231691_1